MMDAQTLINLGLSGAGMALGWFAKTIYNAVKDLESDLANHKVDVAKNYATNADLLRMEDKIDKIIDKLS